MPDERPEVATRGPSALVRMSPETVVDLRNTIAMALGWVTMSRRDDNHGAFLSRALTAGWDVLTEVIGDGAWAPASERWGGHEGGSDVR